MVIKFFSDVSYIEQSSYKYLELIFMKINIIFFFTRNHIASQLLCTLCNNYKICIITIKSLVDTLFASQRSTKL